MSTQAGAYVTICACTAFSLFVVGRPLLVGKSPGRSYWRTGLWFHGFVVAAIVLAAYSNRLPEWFAGKEVRHYDTFMHFYLTGLLAYFLEGLLTPKPVRIGPILIPRTSIALFLISTADEIVFQSLVSHRSPSWNDFFGNAAGAFLFGYLARKVNYGVSRKQ